MLITDRQQHTIDTFRQQYPEYADSALSLVVRHEENNHSITVHPNADPAFSVKYYMVPPFEDVEEEEV